MKVYVIANNQNCYGAIYESAEQAQEELNYLIFAARQENNQKEMERLSKCMVRQVTISFS